MYLDDAEYERNIDANMSKSSGLKIFDLDNSDFYWPTTIKIQFSGLIFLPLWNILQIF